MPCQHTEYAFEAVIKYHLTTVDRSGGQFDAR